MEASKGIPADMKPKEVQLPKDPHVNGQRLEAHLYKDASECPICFLYYPTYLNKTRCCDQPICTECFVQIKRPDPHVPEHVTETGAAPPPETSPGLESEPGELVSEPAQCPYCNQPEFGITYEPPPFRRGLVHANTLTSHGLRAGASAMSSSSSLASGQSGIDRLTPLGIPHRRTTSISATDPHVITTDRVRPDWLQKLAAARAHTARRSAAATALHTAAYAMGGRGFDGDGRSFSGFSRRNLLRRVSGPDPTGGTASQMNLLAAMSERYAQSRAVAQDGVENDPSGGQAQSGSSRRGRMEDLEDMMMMEAIRLSLASEEERRKREDKDTKKEAKKKDKENKKAEKLARKTGTPINTLGDPSDDERVIQTPDDKGKTPQRNETREAWPLSTSSSSQGVPTAGDRSRQHAEAAGTTISSPFRPSHLRTLSNASDPLLPDPNTPEGASGTSMSNGAISTPEPRPTQTRGLSEPVLPGNVGIGPLEFRSLAAMMGTDGNPDESAAGAHQPDGSKTADARADDASSGSQAPG